MREHLFFRVSGGPGIIFTEHRSVRVFFYRTSNGPGFPRLPDFPGISWISSINWYIRILNFLISKMRPGTRTYPIPGYPAIFGLLATRLFTRDGYPEVPATLPQPYYPTGTRVPVGIIGTRPVPRPDFQYPSRPATRHFATRRITISNCLYSATFSFNLRQPPA